MKAVYPESIPCDDDHELGIYYSAIYIECIGVCAGCHFIRIDGNGTLPIDSQAYMFDQFAVQSVDVHVCHCTGIEHIADSGLIYGVRMKPGYCLASRVRFIAKRLRFTWLAVCITPPSFAHSPARIVGREGRVRIIRKPILF